ncbi:MAG: FtsX-like permease family protein [Ketobacter sp.]|nr:FtsX-like permease family protein [Ketobacter sp.]
MMGLSFSFLFIDALEEAMLSMRDYKLRSLLSILGIAIGIAAVILISTISKGGRQFVFNELQTFGLNSIWVFRDQSIVDPIRAQRKGTGIEIEDVDALSANMCCNGLARVTPVIYGARDSSGSQLLVKHAHRYSLPKLEGVGVSYLGINNDQLAIGRGFKQQDIARRMPVTIIGAEVAVDLFGNNAHFIGQHVLVGEHHFEVIGVLQTKDRSFLSSIGSGGGQDVNNRVLLPWTVAQQLFGRNDFDVLQGESAEGTKAQLVGAQMVETLRRRHRGNFEYRHESMASYVQTANRILAGVSLIGIVAAAVSLLVAGLGIMNIMGTSVLERTREIGIRKAIGGSQSAILLQFLIEAALISAVGGIVGLVLGAVASAGLALLANFPFILSVSSIAVAFVVSVLVGLASGFLPAYRASRLHPVQALRYE